LTIKLWEDEIDRDLLTAVGEALGKAEKSINGNVSSTATTAESEDSILKERYLDDAVVVTGCFDPFKEAYSGSVDDVAKANDIVPEV
jgi:hypothetical protein